MCTSKYILILSAHCRLTRFDLSALIPYFNTHKCVFGNQSPSYFGKKITKRYLWSHFTGTPAVNLFSKLENRYFMHNALSLFSSEFLAEHPFDEQLVGKEDRYWANDIVNKGFSYLYTPEFSCIHHYTPNGNTWKGIG